MRYGVEARGGAVVVEASGLCWYPGDGDASLRATLRSLYESGATHVILGPRAVRNLAPGLRTEIRDWARRFAAAGGRLALVSGVPGAAAWAEVLRAFVEVFPSTNAALEAVGGRIRFRPEARVLAPALARI